MTDAEIKELAIKTGLISSKNADYSFCVWSDPLIAFAKELEATTREKMLTGLLEQKPFGYSNDSDGRIIALYKIPPVHENTELLATCECGDGFTLHDRGTCVNCLASMPSFPEGMQLVPIDLLEKIEDSLGAFCGDAGWGQADMDTMDSVSYLLAAPKKG